MAEVGFWDVGSIHGDEYYTSRDVSDIRQRGLSDKIY